MRLCIVLFAFGAWLLQRQAELPDLRYAWLALLAAPCLYIARSSTGTVAIARKVALALVSFAAGFYWAAGVAQIRLDDALPLEWEGRDIDIIGVVASLPQPYERSVRFELDIEHVLTSDARVPERISLSWWNRGTRDVAAAVPEVKPGERWRFTVRLKRPHGTANPHGFDYEAWLLERGVRATGYVRPRGSAERLARMVHRPSYWVEAVRDRVRERILNGLADRAYAGVIAALVMGDQRAIPPEQWQTFTRTGVNHLMSISGLHVTMISGLAYAITLALWRRSARLTLRLPAAKAAVVGGVVAAFLYTLLAGFAVPAQRTLYMIAVVAAALWIGTATSASVVLAAALLVVVAIDPWSVTSAGFWLSFGAVAAILFAVVNRVAQPHWAIAWLRTQAAVTIALLPLLLALFQQVSLISPVANAFAIPVVSLVVVPLALAGSVLPLDLVLYLAHLVMAWCMIALDWLSGLPQAVWQQHAPAEWATAIALAGALWFIFPRGVPGRWVGALLCLPLFFVVPAMPRVGELRITVLDVGQGLAVLLQTARHALLYDTGPAFGPAADSGNRIIAPYLRAVGVARLDGMIVSHDDSDHTGGAASVLQALPVGWLASSLADMDPLPLIADEAFRCYAGQSWDWDGVKFEVLHPLYASYELPLKNNDRGCVLKASAPGGSILIPADIERRSEEILLAQSETLAADVLIAGHHGSKTSSTPAFVQAVSPRTVIFAVGYRNRFGHPHSAVMARYLESGSTLYRTDNDGAVLVTITPEGPIKMERYRSLHRRYWLDAPRDERVVEPQPDGAVQ
jgi:competence protein ComEC